MGKGEKFICYDMSDFRCSPPILSNLLILTINGPAKWIA